MDVLKILIEAGSVVLQFGFVGFVGTFAASLIYIVGQSFLDALPGDTWNTPSLEDEKIRAYGQQKLFELIADGTLTIERAQPDEDDKPKHHYEPAYMLGDDGELLEVIDDKPKRGTSYDG